MCEVCQDWTITQCYVSTQWEIHVFWEEREVLSEAFIVELRPGLGLQKTRMK